MNILDTLAVTLVTIPIVVGLIFLFGLVVLGLTRLPLTIQVLLIIVAVIWAFIRVFITGVE